MSCSSIEMLLMSGDDVVIMMTMSMMRMKVDLYFAIRGSSCGLLGLMFSSWRPSGALPGFTLIYIPSPPVIPGRPPH